MANGNGIHVVVLGGGNGASRMLAAFKPLIEEGQLASLHALVHMADDGGSTGRLRDQYGVMAMGDLTKCLMALSGFHGDVRGEEFLRALEYRFTNGDFGGHTLRNIFLTALEKTSEDIDAAIAVMARILQIPKYSGVIPTTLVPLTQQVYIRFDGESNWLGEGQHSISHSVNLQADPRWWPGEVRVAFKEGDVPLNPRALDVLQKATHIIVAPGHTFGTILPTLALPALGRELKQTKARMLAVMPLLTTPRQTEGWTGEEFVRVYESYIGRGMDAVVANSGMAEAKLVPGQEWVRFAGSEHDYELLSVDLVSEESAVRQPGDVVPRAVVAHDSSKVREALVTLLEPAGVH